MNEKKEDRKNDSRMNIGKIIFFTNGFASFLFFFCLLVSFQDSLGEMKIFYFIF